jgi:tRNA modification GTPase
MAYDLHDTIAAVASAAGGAARGVVRISGPDAVPLLARCFQATEGERLTRTSAPRRISGAIRVAGAEGGPPTKVPGALLLWPGAQSYTRQPAAEFHTIGSPPLLAAVLEELGRHGIRPAEAGEFTLRAFLAGRIDLTQAEGVLGVIDARDRGDLDAALDQVAGGLSRPLQQIREDLLSLLAELEAGLDFVEEDIEFISREALAARLADARAVVAATQRQLGERDQRCDVPRVVLVGAPNAGKSSLFNALLERFGPRSAVPSIVSAQPGATRDYVVGRLSLDGLECELVDTAGVDGGGGGAGILAAAEEASAVQRGAADLRLICIDAAGAGPAVGSGNAGEIVVITMIDCCAADERQPLVAAALGPDAVGCSSVTGAGLDALAAGIRAALGGAAAADQAGGAAATADRCRDSLRRAAVSLDAAAALVAAGGDELLAAEVRHGLDALGEIVGAICTDDVLDRVFGQFCIGK